MVFLAGFPLGRFAFSGNDFGRLSLWLTSGFSVGFGLVSLGGSSGGPLVSAAFPGVFGVSRQARDAEVLDLLAVLATRNQSISQEATSISVRGRRIPRSAPRAEFWSTRTEAVARP